MTNLDLFMKGEVSLETAEAAHVEIHNLRTQLAKSNERVGELESTIQKQSNLLEFYVNDYSAKQLRKEQE